MCEVTFMAIKAVLFDLDNTLYDFSTVHRQALAALAEYGESRFDVPARRFLIAYQEADKQLKRELPHVAACHNRIIICQRMLELLGLPSIVTPLELYETYWGTLLRIMKPRDGAIELLNRLHRRHVRTAIVTDMTAHIQHRKIAALGFAGVLDAMVTSEEAGVEKPNPKISTVCISCKSSRRKRYISATALSGILSAHTPPVCCPSGSTPPASRRRALIFRTKSCTA